MHACAPLGGMVAVGVSWLSDLLLLRDNRKSKKFGGGDSMEL